MHSGINETTTEIKRRYYWPKLSDDVCKYISHCHICQTNKYDRNPPHMELKLTQTPKYPFETVHMDTYSEKTYLRHHSRQIL